MSCLLSSPHKHSLEPLRPPTIQSSKGGTWTPKVPGELGAAGGDQQDKIPTPSEATTSNNQKEM